MGKRILLTGILMLAVSVMTACAQPGTPPMALAKASLTQEEEQMAKLLKTNWDGRIYDYTVDETVASVTITTYELDQNGAWSMLWQNHTACEEPTGRLALNFDLIGNGMEYALQNKGGTSHIGSDVAEKVDTSGMGVATAYAGDSQQVIAYGQEIPLVTQIATTKNSINSYDVEYFAQPEKYHPFGYEHVYAITVTFSQNPLGKR